MERFTVFAEPLAAVKVRQAQGANSLQHGLNIDVSRDIPNRYAEAIAVQVPGTKFVGMPAHIEDTDAVAL